VAVTVERVGIAQADLVFAWVDRLLAELGEEGEDAGQLDSARLLEAWARAGERFQAFVARDEAGATVGVLTLVSSFAIYAQGDYGVINEMFVAPDARSAGVGHALVAAALEFARARGWARVEVTAPESRRWARTQRFYENEGFVFTGPKLKLMLGA